MLASRSFSPYISHPLIRFAYFPDIRILQGVKNENANVRYSALVDLFASFETLLNRLSIFTDIPLTQDLKTVLVEIVVQVLSTLALATK